MGSACAGSTIIVMLPQVSIEGNSMTLGQLATISGDDDILINKLQQFKVGNAPSPGSSLVLTKELVVMRLGNIGSDISSIIWQMPEAVTVTTRCQSLSGQVLLAKAITAIEGRVGRSISTEFSIAPIGSIKDVLIPIGDVQITSDIPYGIRYNSPTSTMITVSVNGQVASKVSLRLDVKLYQQVVVATTSIGLGQLVSTDKLQYERMDSGRLEVGYFTDMDKMQGLIARRSLTPGMVITESMVNKPMLIKRGSIVTILARMSGIEVTTTGQAMQDGREGQLIRVQNISSNKIIAAKVLDISTVQVLSYHGKS